MYKNKKILAIIPARGGSKGLPKKNIRIFLGKPLIVWSIEQAKRSNYVDAILVSTENQEIANVARKNGIQVPFLRPKALATDKSPSIDLIIHALDWFEKKGKLFDILVLLQPTSPLRKRNDLDSAIKKLIDNGDKANCVIGLGEVLHENPYLIKKVDNGYVSHVIKMKKNSNTHQRQQLPKSYFPYGVIFASKVTTLRKEKTFYQKKTMPYFIERWQNFDIDDIYDFLCAEAIIKDKLDEII